MNKGIDRTAKLATAALIAAVYAALTFVSAALGIAFGGIQFRFSEALTVLSVFTPSAIPGLVIGCIIGNIASPMGIFDIIFGSAATLISAVLSYKFRNVKMSNLPLLSILMPVIFNAIIIGIELTCFMPKNIGALSFFMINASEVAVGEAVVCFGGGIPLYYALSKTKIFKT